MTFTLLAPQYFYLFRGGGVTLDPSTLRLRKANFYMAGCTGKMTTLVHTNTRSATDCTKSSLTPTKPKMERNSDFRAKITN